MLIGLPGSGKTTRRSYYTGLGYSYISSDELRKLFSGDERDQSCNDRVWATFYLLLKMNIKYNIDTVLDATNVQLKDRSKFFETIKPYREFIESVEAEVLNTPLKDCIERDSKRERSVGKEVILRLNNKFQRPALDEGFDIIFS